MVGASAGSICSGGSNNTFLGSNTDFTPGVGYYSGSIALGSDAIIDNYNQLMVASNVTTISSTTVFSLSKHLSISSSCFFHFLPCSS